MDLLTAARNALPRLPAPLDDQDMSPAAVAYRDLATAIAGMTIPPNPHPEQVERLAELAIYSAYMPLIVKEQFIKELHAVAASLANRPADDGGRMRTALQEIVDNDDEDATLDDMMQQDRNAGYLTGARDAADIARKALAALPLQPEGVKPCLSSPRG